MEGLKTTTEGWEEEGITECGHDESRVEECQESRSSNWTVEVDYLLNGLNVGGAERRLAMTEEGKDNEETLWMKTK